MAKKPNLRRAHNILIWDEDWHYTQDKNLKGGYVYRKGIEAIRDSPKVDEESARRIAFLSGKYDAAIEEVEKLKKAQVPMETDSTNFMTDANYTK